MNSETEIQKDKTTVPILLVSVFIIAICGILYELLISSISAYFLGSSILHFSITIGLFLSFMGLGAFLSKFFREEKLLANFIWIEIWLGLIGGASGVILYLTYAFTEYYYLIAFLMIACIGTFIGLEIPILTRIVRKYTALKDTLAQVLSFDYLGALIASVLFPLLLLPELGLTRTSFFIGLLNLSIAIFNIWIFRKKLQKFKQQMFLAIASTSLYVFGFFYAFGINAFLEQFLYQDDIVFSTQSPYQKLVFTQWNKDYRLYINGNLQFSSIDEYRYHESLVHIPVALANKPEKVLLLGAGDGLAVRQLLKHGFIKEIHLVDLDPLMTDLGKNNLIFQKLNKRALHSPKVKVFNEDGYKFIEKSSKLYSLIIIDLPDPNDVNISKLYSKEFYELVKKCLAKDGAVVTQASSPFFAPEAFWCIQQTMNSVFPQAIPYTASVPSFGQWGFVVSLPHQKKFDIPKRIHQTLFVKNKLKFQFLNSVIIPSLFTFDQDMQKRKVEINRLDSQVLVQYYQKSWEYFD